MIRFLLTDADGETIRIGVESLRVSAMFLPSLYLMCEFRAAIQGMGNVVYPMLSGFSELIMRICAALLLPALLGRQGLYFVDASAWVPTLVLMVVGYAAVLRHRQSEHIAAE
jgi:Na+-driven multidrug efflux pump